MLRHISLFLNILVSSASLNKGYQAIRETIIILLWNVVSQCRGIQKFNCDGLFYRVVARMLVRLTGRDNLDRILNTPVPISGEWLHYSRKFN